MLATLTEEFGGLSHSYQENARIIP